MQHPFEPKRQPMFDGGSLNRRDWMKLCAAGAVGTSVSGWFGAFANDVAARTDRRRSCILLWMSGGPSQIDTFDLKPGHANGGTFQEIETAVPGMKFSQHLPRLAKLSNHLAVVRSMSTKEGDHSRATLLAHCGYMPQGPVQYPTFGSLIANELGREGAELPNFVSIAPNRAISPASYDPGFLGAQLAPLVVGNGAAVPNGAANQMEASNDLKVQDLEPSKEIPSKTLETRLTRLRSMNGRFFENFSGPPAQSYNAAYEHAVRLMRSEAASAFSLDQEPDVVREAYGKNRFGQGCLLARRLIERNVPFVEITLGGIDQQILGWDTHAENFDKIKQLSQVLDSGWGTLIEELRDRGRLDDTLIVWMGEFGRTPKINPQGGRDHYPQVWSTVLAGGGIQGGQTIGRTSADGMEVEDRPVAIPDLLATICQGLGIDPMKSNISNVGRPIRLVDPAAKALKEIVG
ncbi:DUF1501 domain-containing protein [Schlesneria paludicola]|uniref:DUF1501 domain-containing protein n=1 Tax=Schlesneria paludicola TaxID=360056 RepID=UPI00029A0CFC|nr:DUF1501 domain-containing protein [Schlesneria paludicola]